MYNYPFSNDFKVVSKELHPSHFMMGVENVKNLETKEVFPKEAMIASRIAKKCQESGVIVRPVGNFIVISPPLILTRNQIDDLVEALRKGIGATVEELSKEGVM